MFSLFNNHGEIRTRKFHIKRFSDDLYYVEAEQIVGTHFWAGILKSKNEILKMNFSNSYIITAGNIEDEVMSKLYNGDSC
jgi:hypothetical protein